MAGTTHRRCLTFRSPLTVIAVIVIVPAALLAANVLAVILVDELQG